MNFFDRIVTIFIPGSFMLDCAGGVFWYTNLKCNYNTLTVTPRCLPYSCIHSRDFNSNYIGILMEIRGLFIFSLRFFTKIRILPLFLRSFLDILEMIECGFQKLLYYLQANTEVLLNWAEASVHQVNYCCSVLFVAVVLRAQIKD